MKASVEAPGSELGGSGSIEADESAKSLIPPGNPLRPRALVYALAAGTLLLVLMASDAHFALSVPLGLMLVLVLSFGVLDFAGCFDDAGEPALGRVSLAVLAPRLVEVAAAGVGWLVALRLAVAGSLPGQLWSAPLLIGVASVGCVMALARLLARAGLLSLAKPLGCRADLWLVVVGVVLYLPLLGSFSLLDPWETHYGEVAREMLARDDWLSLWWGQDGWFWSKPVLDFWLQGLFFSVLGVRFRPDEMLANAANGGLPQPEWAARLPIALFSLLSVYLLYRFVAAAAGRRAGFLAGVALLTAPYWSLLSHQSMTDMPYVAALTAALSLFGLGLLTRPDETVRSLGLRVAGRTLQVSGFHLLFFVVLASVLPQLVYLLSRHLTLQMVAPPYGFRWHFDEFFSGSAGGNCGLPGNETCRGVAPANGMFQPVLGAALFGAALGYLVHLNRGERRRQRLFFLAAWYFTALAALAKGAPGLVLPVVIAAATLVAMRRWRDLTRLELAGFCLLFAAVCLPWYVQSYMRHGEPFTDRLLFHDMYKRAFAHVHDTNAGNDVSFRYYLWQLGYGLFPWTGLAMAGLSVTLRRATEASQKARVLATLSLLWLVVSFGMFSLSLTKFHHYALPCVPPLAIGAALFMDRALAGTPRLSQRNAALYAAAMLSATLMLVYGASRLLDGTAFGRVLPPATLPPASPVQAGVFLSLGLGLAGFSQHRLLGALPEPKRQPLLGALGIVAGLITLLVTRDLASSAPGDVSSSARLLHLITYNYKRTWPASLDFTAVQWGFGAVASVCCFGLAQPRLRRHAAVILCAVCVWFCVFTVSVYLPRVAPHFGQRELFLTYYRTRQSPREPIVAYQMNWKGENFYAGNRLPAFVSSGAKFKAWLKRQRSAGTRILFFVTEHGRVGTLKSELGPLRTLTTLTDKLLNNKFALVRVELAEPSTQAAPDTE